ncbi:L,D-transpeptidase [Patescibacteria group bacterium]|nr:L,D-transpeptidase [Patescibacteria group bacterium]
MARFLPLIVGLVVLIAAITWPRSELTSKAFVQEIYNASGQLDPTASKGVWFNKDVSVPDDELARIIGQIPPVLGASTGTKWIDVDLTTQTLRAYEGDTVVYQFPVSTGLPWFPTVTGSFRIWAKIKAQRMTGGDVAAGTFYDLPNVPFVQYFYKGYGLHGTYWHHDFGKPRSHGCVNLSIPDAEKLFYWTNPALPDGKYSLTNIDPNESTQVIIHGTTPTNIY